MISEANFVRLLQVAFMGLIIYFFYRRDLQARIAETRLREEMREEIRSLTDEVRYEMTPTQRARIEGSILAILSSGKKAVGVAFFVSPTTALTVAHNLALRGKGVKYLKTVTCARTESGERFSFVVVALDEKLDVAVLRLVSGQRESAHFLTIPNSIVEASNGTGLFFITCNIRMTTKATDAISFNIATHKVRVFRLNPHNILYDTPTFNGDSDGAIVVARTGVVIGLHCELVNAAREVIEHKTAFGSRLDAFEDSLKSLIGGTSFGCVGVRLDCDIVQSLLRLA
jgi:hypothetical protein